MIANSYAKSLKIYNLHKLKAGLSFNESEETIK